MVSREPLSADDPAELGRYRLLGRLGAGGMGVVYLAEDPDGQQVALKVIRPHLAEHREFRERFRSEVTLARKVARFCTAPILDSDTSAARPYVVTEYIDGPTLAEVVREHGPLSGSQLHALGVGVISALTAIHRAGIVHRDLKPSNVMLSRFGPRVIDFGIARAADAVTGITTTGHLVGTPAFMAPEQLKGEPVTPATDLFAWGAVMAFAGTGRQPFGTSPEAVVYRVTIGEPDIDGLDPHLLDAVRSALRKDPAERPTAQQLLEKLLHDEHGEHGEHGRGATPAAVASGFTAATTVDATPPDGAGSPAVSSGAADVAAADPEAVDVEAAARSARSRRRRRAVAWAGGVTAALAAGGLVAATTISTPGVRDGGTVPAASPSPAALAATPVRFDDRARGPAAPVPGARRGGTVTGLQSAGWSHLDPQRNDEPDPVAAGSVLLYRTLTGYVDDGRGGLRLVGDLATDTGRTPDGGKTWTYTLRAGLKYQDASPITAADVAYGVARSFAAEIDGGATYLQNWLVGTAGEDFRDKWPGPYRSGQDVPPGVRVGDGETITFTFAEPHPEFPMVAALGTTAPVPKSEDARGQYDRRIFSSGPYRIDRVTEDRLELVRNRAWDPATDPIRTAYPDRWILRSGVDPVTATQRLIRPSGADAATFAWTNVPEELAAQITGDLRKRALDGATPYNQFIAINTQRITDVTVRKAINASIDRQQALQVYRGASYGVATTAVLSSVMPGYRRHEGAGVPVTGDPAAARRLLGGRRPALTYAHRDDDRNRKLATYLQLALENVGFQVTLAPIRTAEYLAAIGRKDNRYDLYLNVWGPDIPDASGIFPHLFAGEAIHAAGSSNTAFFSDPAINAEIRKLQAEPDRAKAAAGYGDLDERLLRDHTPVVPLFDRRHFSLHGPAVGGLTVSRVLGAVALERAHVLR